MAASDLYDLAAEWLAVCEEAVSSTARGAIDAEATYVSAGPPPLDCCEQLTVHTVGSVDAPTAPFGPLVDGQKPKLFSLHFVGLVATVIRSISVVESDGTLPDAATMTEDGKATMEDLWAILNFTRQRHREELLFASPSGTRELFLDPQVVVPAQGGLAGWAIPIRVALGGYSLSS